MDGILALLCIVVSLSLLVYLVVSFISWLGQRPCEMCGTSAKCRDVQGFKLCKKCTRIAKSSTSAIGDLIVQGTAARTAMEGKAGGGSGSTGDGCGGLIFKLVGSACVGFLLLVFLVSDSGQKLVGRVAEVVEKPRLPVVITKRPSAVGEGLVLSFENQTDHQITVGVIIERDGQNAGKWGVSVPPNGSKEFGWAEGWAFKKGDKVVLVHSAYRDETHVID